MICHVLFRRRQWPALFCEIPDDSGLRESTQFGSNSFSCFSQSSHRQSTTDTLSLCAVCGEEEQASGFSLWTVTSGGLFWDSCHARMTYKALRSLIMCPIILHQAYKTLDFMAGILSSLSMSQSQSEGNKDPACWEEVLCLSHSSFILVELIQ